MVPRIQNPSITEAFPLLKCFGLALDATSIKGYSLAGIVNTTADQAYKVHELESNGERFELRVCGLGDSARFEWVNSLGKVVGESFDILTAHDLDRLKPVNLRH